MAAGGRHVRFPRVEEAGGETALRALAPAVPWAAASSLS